MHKVCTVVLALGTGPFFCALETLRQLLQGAGLIGVGPPAGLGRVGVLPRSNLLALPVHQQRVVGCQVVLWPSKVCTHHMQPLLQGFDQGAAKALAAVQ